MASDREQMELPVAVASEHPRAAGQIDFEDVPVHRVPSVPPNGLPWLAPLFPHEVVNRAFDE
jgi:hypothetical protein